MWLRRRLTTHSTRPSPARLSSLKLRGFWYVVAVALASGGLIRALGFFLESKIMASGKPTNEEIVEAIQASGYLMEQEVATVLESIGFHVETNRAFEDVEESKSREIDVWAFRNDYRNEETKFRLDIELICECKNNANPFVFITRPKNERDKTQFAPREYLFPVQTFEKTLEVSPDGKRRSYTMIPAFQYLGLAEHHHYYKQDSKAVQFCKIVRSGKSWEANHGGIYDSIFYPLIKAFVSREQLLKSLRKKEPTLDTWKHITLFFPIIVLYGDMYSVDSLSDNPEPVSISNIAFTRELKSKVVEGKFVVDFVRMDSLKLFIETQIAPFVRHIIEKLEQNPNLFMTKIVE